MSKCANAPTPSADPVMPAAPASVVTLPDEMTRRRTMLFLVSAYGGPGGGGTDGISHQSGHAARLCAFSLIASSLTHDECKHAGGIHAYAAWELEPRVRPDAVQSTGTASKPSDSGHSACR